jgi:UDP-2-acetamido-2,6-beta-L-arabino-hexul-4-ose reductase
MKILLTGSRGFIGRNFCVRARETADISLSCIYHDQLETTPQSLFDDYHAIVHLAGVNRPNDSDEFESGNAGFTRRLCEMLALSRTKPAIIYASSMQVNRDNLYGASKRSAESYIESLVESKGGSALIYRLPNVFGKWCRPNYNSAVATFCYNLVRGLPIAVHDASAPLTLAYIDDVVDVLLAEARKINAVPGCRFGQLPTVYNTTVGQIAESIQSFAASRVTNVTAEVGSGLTRALYATYLSYIPREDFAYTLKRHEDARGEFVEFLKTPTAGQFSYFTAHPGVTRGGHYHHTKNEKFLVLSGRARFRFRHVETGESHELIVDGGSACVVETVPGWAHDVTNIGGETLVVMLWANEQFDPKRPDTIAASL